MNKKGFLFTISIILFATTLVFYAQVYSENILRNESLIVDDYKYNINNFMNNDIALDILDIFNVNADFYFKDNNASVIINGKMPSENEISKINDYEEFLDNNYFSRFNGVESVDLTNIKDSTFDINFSTFDFVYNYSEEIIYTNSSYVLLDLNLFVNGDINSIQSDFEDGGVQVRINYFDDSNIISFIENIDIDDFSFLKFIYNDSNLLLKFGNDNGRYFSLDSNNVILNYELRIVNNFDSNYFKANIDSKIFSKKENFDSNSFISIN